MTAFVYGLLGGLAAIAAHELYEWWRRRRHQIIRCRDCKFYELVPEDSGDWCQYWTDRVYRTDGFCAWGERRET